MLTLRFIQCILLTRSKQEVSCNQSRLAAVMREKNVKEGDLATSRRRARNTVRALARCEHPY